MAIIKMWLKRLIKSSYFLRVKYLRYAIRCTTEGRCHILAKPDKITERWEKATLNDWDGLITETNSPDYLFGDILRSLSSDSPIIDLGCGTGRTMNYLFEHGYKNLTGIDISNAAFLIMSKQFPECYKQSKTYLGALPDILRKFHDKSYDLVYARGLLVSIPPRDNNILDEMTRLSRKFILLQSNEGSWDAFPRNLEKMMERLGWCMITYKIVIGINDTEVTLPAPYKKKYLFKSSTQRLFVERVL